MELSVCICTRDRPDELREALKSLAGSSVPIAEVIVSDDMPSAETRNVAKSAPVLVRYLEAPRAGLAANRNHALLHVTMPYLLFIDDDCRLAPTFAERAFACMARYEGRVGCGKVVVSGAEKRQGNIVKPGEQSFLGFQNRHPRRPDRLKSVVINSTLFPTPMAQRVRFDARLRYGSEEVDFATRMVAHGAYIVFCPEAVNDHLVSPRGRSTYEYEATASRLYATFKRYALTEHRLIAAALFVALAPLHAIAAGARRAGFRGAAEGVRAVGRATAYTASLAVELMRNRRRR